MVRKDEIFNQEEFLKQCIEFYGNSLSCQFYVDESQISSTIKESDYQKLKSHSKVEMSKN